MSPTPDRTVQSLFSLLGVVAFALIWWWRDIYAATLALMGFMIAQVVVLKVLRRPVDRMTWVTLALVVVMGGLTLLLREKLFIQMKTTVVYALFASALFVSDRLLNKNLLKMAMDSFFDAPDAVWRSRSTAFSLYFLLLALVNWLVVRNLSEASWVAIKTFAFPIATLCFTVLILFSLFRYARPERTPS